MASCTCQELGREAWLPTTCCPLELYSKCRANGFLGLRHNGVASVCVCVCGVWLLLATGKAACGMREGESTQVNLAGLKIPPVALAILMGCDRHFSPLDGHLGSFSSALLPRHRCSTPISPLLFQDSDLCEQQAGSSSLTLEVGLGTENPGRPFVPRRGKLGRCLESGHFPPPFGDLKWEVPRSDPSRD